MELPAANPGPRPRVAARIQHHPSRRDLIKPLVESLAPLPVVVSPHASEPPNPWAGYQLALQSGLKDPTCPTHVLVLQDDSVVCQNFAEAITRIATSKPDEPVVLFHSRLPPRSAADIVRAAKARECYVRFWPSKFVPAVAILWPVAAGERFLRWANSGVRLPGYPNVIRSDDAVIGEWQRRNQETIWATSPSLVDHPDRVQSIIGKRAQWGRDKGRVAHFFIGQENPLSYSW